MAIPRDESTDPGARSWVESANEPGIDFPIQNLPLGIMRPRGSSRPWRVATAIGSHVLDLGRCAEEGLFARAGAAVVAALRQPTLNSLMALGDEATAEVRRTLHLSLRDDASPTLRAQLRACVFDQDSQEYALPASVGDFTDFFASVHHASRVARLRNPDAALPFAYPYAPLAYHARASTLVVSDTPVSRPSGPRRVGGRVRYGPTERLDYEAELGIVVSREAPRGRRVPLRHAREHILGVCLLNDWSARDVQAFESQPLGPFLSKSFATTLSPWVVTKQALDPFRVSAPDRPVDLDPALPYLQDEEDRRNGAWSIIVSVHISSPTMREMAIAPSLLSRGNAQTLFWTPAQLVAHQTANGCHLRPGDVLGTGTLSGPEPGSEGCLLELTRAGHQPVTLPTGERRAFLEDGDEVVITAECQAPGAVRIGFGACRGRIMPHTD